MSTHDGVAIDLRGVTVRQGGRTWLEGIDLQLDQGRACAIVGSNGSGKSALLRVVAALARPSAGQVRVGGWDALVRPDQVRRLIGYVPDEGGLAERLTPLEHLGMVAAQHGLGRADRRAAAESMLELVDLADHDRADVATLSRGQRRRLALAMALVHDPPIILLDEPVAGVDEVGRGELLAVLLELRAMEKTLLIASQSHADVAEVCDVVAPLAAGRLRPLVEQGTTTLTWIEVVGDPDAAVRALRERPGVDDVRQDGSFVTFQGPSTGEERSLVTEWLIGRQIHLAGFGATGSPAGGDRP
ncbi:MAG: ABC transporter ATP-binding protein [Chloroflexota bacterium]